MSSNFKICGTYPRVFKQNVYKLSSLKLLLFFNGIYMLSKYNIHALINFHKRRFKVKEIRNSPFFSTKTHQYFVHQSNGFTY